MAQIKNLIAKWGAAWPSPMIISRQYDNGQYRIDLFNYPEPEHIVDEQTEQMEVLSYYLIVWMKETEDGEPREMSPIQLSGPYWIVPNYYTQLVQDIRFQFCVQSDSTDYEAHSAIFTGRIVDSIEHDGDPVDVTPAEMFDAYKAYVNDLIVAAGDVQIDTSLSVSGAAAEAAAVGAALSSTNERLLNAFPTDTASGEVASFNDGADGLPVKSLVVDIEPKQSGSGDPSPTNVRPISGWTGVEVTHAGNNLFDSNFSDYTKPYNYYIHPIKLENGKRYKLKAELVGTTITGASFGLVKSGNRYEEFVGPYYVVGANGNAQDFNITVNDTFTAPKLVAYVSGENQFNEVLSNYNVMLMPYEQVEYEPYNGQSITIALGQTVYGGVLDVLTGKLTVTDANIQSYNGETLPSTWISDRDVYSAGATPTTGAQVVYKLSTPIEITLDPHEVESLLGQNNIYADTGDSTVVYRADPTLYITRKIAEAVSALS